MSGQKLRIVYLLVISAFEIASVLSRAVNISNVWFLPEEEFPVFYRYFHDRVTWFEAEAVCQLHHGNLVTTGTGKQYDTTRAYLKELDVLKNVWVGLKREGPNDEFLWTDYKMLSKDSGYWNEQIPKSEAPLCVVMDPAADFRWHTLNCGGPETASFICELPVPPWAKKSDGCMLTSLPSLTVTYVPEQAAVELTSDCGLDGTRRIACKGQADHAEMIRQLSCDNTNMEGDEDGGGGVSAISTTLEVSGETQSHQPPTRFRRDTEEANPLVVDLLKSTSTLVPSTSPDVTYNHEVTLSSSSATTSSSMPPLVSSSSSSSSVSLSSPSLLSPSTSSQALLLASSQSPLPSPSSQSQLQVPSSPIPPSSSSSPASPPSTASDISSSVIRGIIYTKSRFLKNLNKMKNTSVQENYQNITTKKESKIFKTVLGSKEEVGNGFQARDTNISIDSRKSSLPEPQNIIRDKANKPPKTKSIHDKIPTLFIKVTFPTLTFNNTSEILEESHISSANDEQKGTHALDNNVGHYVDAMTDFEEETRRRQLLPASLRVLNKEESNITKSQNPIDNQEEEDTQLQLENSDQEIPSKPNRGRRLTRPKGHSFYPYFLNRVLG